MASPPPKRSVGKNRWTTVLITTSMVLIVGIAIATTVLFMRDGGDGGNGTALTHACAACEANGEKVSFGTIEELAKHKEEEHGGDGEAPTPPQPDTLAKLPLKQMVCRVVPGLKIVTDGETVERWYDIFWNLTAAEVQDLSDWEKDNLLIKARDGSFGMGIPPSHGSGFLITSDGHILTNQHVVDHTEKLVENPNILRRFKRHGGYTSIEPQVYVLFDGVSYEAELKHVSKNFDMAILKADIETMPKPHTAFELSASNDVPIISDIFVLGFPGEAERAGLSIEEQRKRMEKLKNHKKITEAFDKNQLTMNSNKGAIGKIKDDEELGRIIQYDCDSAGGNSGGPAVTPDGVVRGIHSWGLNAKDEDAKNKINGAGLLLPMRGEIDGNVGASKVQWVDKPDEEK